MLLPCLALAQYAIPTPDPNDPTGLPPLRESRVDLRIVNSATGLAHEATMRGTGSARGRLSIRDANPDGRGAVNLWVEIARAAPGEKRIWRQTLALRFEHGTRLIPGTRARLGKRGNEARYEEDGLTLDGQAAGNAGGLVWKATKGTVEVKGVSLEGVTLRLTNVVLALEAPNEPHPITISGSATGR